MQRLRTENSQLSAELRKAKTVKPLHPAVVKVGIAGLPLCAVRWILSGWCAAPLQTASDLAVQLAQMKQERDSALQALQLLHITGRQAQEYAKAIGGSDADGTMLSERNAALLYAGKLEQQLRLVTPSPDAVSRVAPVLPHLCVPKTCFRCCAADDCVHRG